MEDVESSVAVPVAPQAQIEPERNGKRNRNLDILKAYIQRQRTLLERIKLDIDRLHEFKRSVGEHPLDALHRILHSDNSSCPEEGRSDGVFEGVGKLSTLVDQVREGRETAITRNLDWELFQNHDPAPFHSLAPCSWSSMGPPSSMRMPPPPTLSTPSPGVTKSSLSALVYLTPECRKSAPSTESALRVRVRQMRAHMVDPVLAQAAQFLSMLPSDPDDECTKAVRAKEVRETKDARAREAREARAKDAKARPKTMARSKATSRRKSDPAVAMAMVRLRGQGGRFKKLGQADRDAPAQQAASALGSASTSTSTVPTPGLGPSSSTHQRYLLSTTPSVVGLDDGPFILEGGRSRRTRRPSVRVGSPTHSVVSAASVRSAAAAATGRGKGKMRASSTAHWHSSSSSSASLSPGPDAAPRVRLTIRIPPRGATLTWSAPSGVAAPVSIDGRELVSASTSFGTTTSANTSFSMGSTMEACERHSYSPATTMRSASLVRFVGVKQEEERGELMDVDSAGDEGRAGLEDRHARDTASANGCTHLAQNPKPEASPDSAFSDSDSDTPVSDGDDSFVCELLPSVNAEAGSSVSSQAAYRNENTNGLGSANGNRDGRSSRRGDNKSTTFNQTWSDEEQKLLDMLLEQFPDGTKNRWANISKGMGGLRTPRQVASRVQKYFAKMKKWGVDLK